MCNVQYRSLVGPCNCGVLLALWRPCLVRRSRGGSGHEPGTNLTITYVYPEKEWSEEYKGKTSYIYFAVAWASVNPGALRDEIIKSLKNVHCGQATRIFRHALDSSTSWSAEFKRSVWDAGFYKVIACVDEWTSNDLLIYIQNFPKLDDAQSPSMLKAIPKAISAVTVRNALFAKDQLRRSDGFELRNYELRTLPTQLRTIVVIHDMGSNFK